MLDYCYWDGLLSALLECKACKRPYLLKPLFDLDRWSRPGALRIYSLTRTDPTAVLALAGILATPVEFASWAPPVRADWTEEKAEDFGRAIAALGSAQFALASFDVSQGIARAKRLSGSMPVTDREWCALLEIPDDVEP